MPAVISHAQAGGPAWLRGWIPAEPAEVAWSRTDLNLLAAVSAAGAVIRAVYLALVQGLPPYDPWRHLVLLRNLRAGAGFTLFDGQPYVFYQPPWYWLCSLLPEGIRAEWLAALFSAIAVPLLFVLLRQEGAGRFAATAGGLLAAAYGPLVRYTCHMGPEAFALTLMLAAFVLLRARREWLWTFISGVLFGIALLARMNFVFAGLLLLPGLTRPRRFAALGLGSFLPLAAGWWRNHAIIERFDYVFAWDGIAAATRGFNVLSTLVIQMHPTVGEGLRRLHEQIAPNPEWLVPGPTMAFLLLAIVCVMAARHSAIAVSFAVAFVYFLGFDRTATANFYRIWTGLFPLMLMAIALASGRLAASPRSLFKRLAAGVVLLALALGASDLAPPNTFPLEMVTPPSGLLEGDRYMVNGTFFHPESVIYRYPHKRFIGLPLDPAEFDAFSRAYPEFDAILWHDLSVQDELREWLLTDGGYTITGRGTNAFGRRYSVLRPAGHPRIAGR